MGLDVDNQPLEFNVGLADLVVERVRTNQFARGRTGVDKLDEGIEPDGKPVQVASSAGEIAPDVCEFGADRTDKVAGRFAQ